MKRKRKAESEKSLYLQWISCCRAIKSIIFESDSVMNEMTKLVLALGSNTDPESNMAMAKQLLASMFKNVTFSNELWTDPIGIASGRFLNCLAVGYTGHGYNQVQQALKRLETKIGNTKANRLKGIVKIDVDVLKYGDRKYHTDDWERGYVQQLICQLGVE